MQKFILWQFEILIAIFVVIFISFDYKNPYIFIFVNNGVNGILFGLMQVNIS